MTLKDAIEKVLREARRPLSTDEICNRVLAKGLWHTNGKTPSATVGAQIYTSIKDGENRFVKVGKGVFGLTGVKYGAVVMQTGKTRVSVRKVERDGDSGYVYILTNPCFRKDWVKIGKTSRPVDTRSKELDNTSIPLPFEVYAMLKTNNMTKIERLIQGLIEEFNPALRIRRNREFFNIPPAKALGLLAKAAEILDEGDNIVLGPNVHESTVKKQVRPKKPRVEARPTPTLSGREKWKTKTQLANLLAEHGGNPGSGGHLQLTLSGKRKCPVTSRWRPVLSSVGIKFDANDFVVDWTKAKNPLPWA